MSVPDVWWIYLLRTDIGRLYTGMAKHVDRRLRQHRSGYGALSMKRSPAIELIGAVPVGSRPLASRFERRVKRWRPVKRLSYFSENADTWQALRPSGKHCGSPLLCCRPSASGCVPTPESLNSVAELVSLLAPTLVGCLRRWGICEEAVVAGSISHMPNGHCAQDLIRVAALQAVADLVIARHKLRLD